ncbi:MAG: hypothetical protein K8J08_08085, partial [Thermoanaerobaculia bacterium]|nr:hypothetical protein [Thermoanaerobaculia bacterium]
MELLAFLLGLLGLAILFGPSISAFVLAAKLRRQGRRLEDLEREFGVLREQFERRTRFLRDQLQLLQDPETEDDPTGEVPESPHLAAAAVAVDLEPSLRIDTHTPGSPAHPPLSHTPTDNDVGSIDEAPE